MEINGGSSPLLGLDKQASGLGLASLPTAPGQAIPDTNAVNLGTTTGVAADRWRLKKDQHICASSLGAVVLMIIQNCVIYAKGDEDWIETFVVCTETALILMTILSIIFLVQYYRNLLTLKQQEWAKGLLKGKSMIQQVVAAKQAIGESKHSYQFITSSLFPKFVGEVIVHLILPYPWVPRDWYLYQILQLLMFLRLYLVVRMLHTSSDAFLKRSRISAYYEDFRRMNLKIRWRLTLKMIFYDNPVLMTIYCLVVSLLVAAFCMFVLERDKQADFAEPGNCLWFAFITSSTIGYGDMVPVTITGRFLTCCIGIIGHVIAAMFGGILTNKLALSRNEQLISVFCDNQVAHLEYKIAATTLIQHVWRETKQHEREAKKQKERRGGSAGAALSGIEKAAKQEDDEGALKRLLKINNHKRNKIYGAVKEFRNRRHQLAKAQLMATDSVLDEKIDNLTATVESLVQIIKTITPRDPQNSFNEADEPSFHQGKHASFNFRHMSSAELRPNLSRKPTKNRKPTHLSSFTFPQHHDSTMLSPLKDPFRRRGSSLSKRPKMFLNPLRDVGLLAESVCSSEAGSRPPSPPVLQSSVDLEVPLVVMAAAVAARETVKKLRTKRKKKPKKDPVVIDMSLWDDEGNPLMGPLKRDSKLLNASFNEWQLPVAEGSSDSCGTVEQLQVPDGPVILAAAIAARTSEKKEKRPKKANTPVPSLPNSSLPTSSTSQSYISPLHLPSRPSKKGQEPYFANTLLDGLGTNNTNGNGKRRTSGNSVTETTLLIPSPLLRGTTVQDMLRDENL